ncbi:MAG: poly-gamma-glutamate biosynthesis protein PgsC [Deltaproteobacteria bacterium]|nr:MAG: poly-gamma-glutamate biosynthesis protein PgsC [Deltaproteobacteria bacterium]
MAGTSPDLLVTAIALGLVVSLVFSEALGLAAGGMVVPGYIALNLVHPIPIVMTLVIGIASFGIVKLLDNIMIVYGRRRTVVLIIVGFLLGWFCKTFLTIDFAGETLALQAVGFIIPGLVGLWIDRQGIIETTATMLTSGVLVRLGLILIFGGEMYTWQ